MALKVGQKANLPLSLEVDFDFTHSNTCGNQTVRFFHRSPLGTQLSYAWNFGDGNVSDQRNPTHTYNIVGIGTQTVSVSLTVTDEEGNTGTRIQTLEIQRIPSLDMSADSNIVTFDNITYFVMCENSNSTFTFYNTSSTALNNETYTIDWGDGSPLATLQNWSELSHTYPMGIYDITYSITSSTGCTATKKYGVFVGGNPAVGLGNPGNTNVCTGSSITFPISGTDNNPIGTRYIVTFSDDPSNPQIFQHPAPKSVTHTFERGSCNENSNSLFPNSFFVTIVAENPCSGSLATVVPIYVSGTPAPEIHIPNDVLCVNNGVNISNISRSGDDISTNGQCSRPKNVWEITPSTGWSLSSGSMGSMINPNSVNSWVSGTENIQPLFTEPGTYTIKLTTGNRCGSEVTEKTICVLPTPEPKFEIEQNNQCGPSTVKLKNISNVLELCENDMFTWSISQSRGCGVNATWSYTTGNDSSPEAEIEFNSPGEYSITLNAVSSCGVYRETKSVVIAAAPTVNLNLPQSICGSSPIRPSASVASCGDEQTSYLWTFEDGTPSSSSSMIPGEVTFTGSGTKKVTLAVTNICGTTEITQEITINDYPILDLGEDIEACFGETIALGSQVSFEENHTYRWSSSPYVNISNFNIHNPTATPQQTTTFYLQVTNTRTGCVISDEFTVKVNPAPSISFDQSDQNICSGETSNLVNIITNPVGEDVSWTLAITDVEGVTQTTGTGSIPAQTLINKTGTVQELVYTATIEGPSAGDCRITPTQYKITVHPEPVLQNDQLEICSDQPINYFPISGIQGMTYTWTVDSNPGIIGSIDQSIGSPSINQTLRNITNTPLKVLYTITPYLNDCKGDDFELEVTILPSPSVNFSIGEQSLCSGEASQEIQISSDVNGAEFSWEAKANGIEGVIPSGTGNRIPIQTLINNSSAPVVVEYMVMASTSVGGNCSGVPSSYRITVYPRLSMTSTISDYSGYAISCAGQHDGYINPIIQGGDGNYTFSWIGPNGFVSREPYIQNLFSGTYTLSVDDGVGCQISQSYTLTEPLPLALNIENTVDILCAGLSTGAIYMSVGGGVPPYSYQWQKDGELLNTMSLHLENAPAGNYILTITDSNGCQLESSQVTISEPDTPLLIEHTKGDISCYDANDGFINLNITGGEPPYQIIWSNNSTQPSQQNLGPGTYIVQIIDQIGCIKSETIIIEDAPLFRISPELRQISCFGKNDGYIKLNFEGGVGQPSVRWDHGEDKSELFNLSSGTYGVTITDDTACEIRSVFNIIEPGLLVIESAVTDALDCNIPSSGAINIEISGGTPPFTYLWSNGSISKDLLSLNKGQYSLTVTDANGCQSSSVFSVKRPEPLQLSAIRRTNITCEPRLIQEEIELSISGGVAPYTINWSGGEVNQNGYNMQTNQAGLYAVEVIDGHGCIRRESFEIVLSDVILEIGIESASFESYQTHLVNHEIQFLNKSFGDILTFHWDFGDGNYSFEENPTHQYQAEGEYEITLRVTDIYGCYLTTSRTIQVYDYFLKIPDAFTPNGDGTNDFYFPKFLHIESLEFWILNKWGENIYYTKDMMSDGWDGTISGTEAQAGNYVYRLEFKTLDGRKQQMTGVFLLLR
ncbi:PKD domain-containing protein [Belliella kenyensis]|nr:PKD domain-containing protein [Belliella kenyensis]MDN3602789.1 PKD domain-containing protein [Belliella kenyensis]